VNLERLIPASLIEGNNTATDNTLGLPKNLGDTLPKTLFTNANSGTASLQIRVNFQRDINTSLNPFRVNFNDFNVYDKIYETPYNLIVSNELSHDIDTNATMVYGRTNTPRSRFNLDANQEALIYYEIFCADTDISGTICSKALLPNRVPTRNGANQGTILVEVLAIHSISLDI